MNTEQIIKALECCTQKNEKGWLSPVCVDCPFSIGKDDCKALDEYALALIKEQQAQIEKYKNLAELRMQDNKDTCELLFKEEDKNKELQAHNENLKREDKYLRDRLAEEMEHSKDMKVTADIVRCKDCIFCKYNSSALTYRCDRRGYYPEEVKESGFCSYGRRTDDEV